MKKFHGMKIPRVIQFWEQDKSEKQYRLIPAHKVTEIERPARVRGYRVDKPEFKDSFFFPKYSQAVKILLMGIRGKGKIEAVR